MKSTRSSKKWCVLASPERRCVGDRLSLWNQGSRSWRMPMRPGSFPRPRIMVGCPGQRRIYSCRRTLSNFSLFLRGSGGSRVEVFFCSLLSFSLSLSVPTVEQTNNYYCFYIHSYKKDCTRRIDFVEKGKGIYLWARGSCNPIANFPSSTSRRQG